MNNFNYIKHTKSVFNCSKGGFITSILKYFHNPKKSKIKKQNQKTEKKLPPKIKLSLDLASNIEIIKKMLGFSSDITVRNFTISPDCGVKAAVIFIKGLAERELINEQVIGALMLNDRFGNVKNTNEFFQMIKQYGLPNTYVNEESDINNIVTELIDGNTILLLDKIDKVLIVGSTGWKDRSISEPSSENSVRGPKDCFTENIENNSALIRRHIKSSDLRIESFKIGTKTKTTVLIAYLKGIAREGVINEVRERLGRIEIDGILESGYIEELIEDTPSSMFPQIEHSERPDKISAAILEGRVAILVDTTPYVLIVPTIFVQFIQSVDDYYQRFPVGSFARFIRVIAYFISVLLPSLYIALTSFHQEMIPTTLALSIAASREGVPFPSIGEAFMMEITFEILMEAGLRLPKQAGQAVSIVGGLVIGQAAVQAGIVSQAMVIVVALTGISSFAIPAFNASSSGRLLRFPLMIVASVLGLPGILAGVSIIVIHLNSLRSFGVNYMEPFISADKSITKDTILRNPWWKVNRLPGYIARKSIVREAPNMKPGPKANSTEKDNNS
ncbi:MULTISPECIES: spore germination protein [Clostridium]|uniref:Spore germination protein B1 n=3 Tax=Clostridium TaxID=1485 RepID=A0ABX2TQX7_CLOLD|nr:MULTISPECIES: spore germination protein [Clostridium]AGY75964.1 spore germination protein [Clostridium autoethanogenum DSM 10061]ALU36128.1 GerA spore germination protein [Clostridium autoethanogenum DSM 10061]OAA85298.1 Spore germination protein B1 [Clostridium ljungdahlii DSM 13528]OVY51814.1 Spore germination protein B1 [Clostridium autoethanogenum]